ncbi:hypothetical protein K0U00_38835, partial [Paenibacillus sepulcri]|nr:hypothetical protein [Paenibacillus sepulcri]
MVTATADATHFTNCRGTILIEDCLFENQLDDPCNVHGIYVRVSERISEDTLLVRFMHEMTVGIDFTGMGDIVRFINNESLLPYAEASVRSAELVNEEYMLITFDQPLPSAVGEYHVIENVTWNPDLTVRRCTVRANRARGFLITTPGRVLLEHNTISAPGAGIKISGDANSWYESGAVQDVTIRYNTFLDCNYCYPDWGRAVIDIDPEIENPESHEECYHRNIRIQENVFDTFESPLVYGHSIDGFTFTGNVVRRSGNYPMHGGRPYTIELRAARNTVITGNRFEGGEPRAALLENAEVNLPVES